MDWVKVLAVAVATVGWIQWAKHILPPTVPSVAYAIVMPVVAVGMGAVFFLTPSWVQVGVLAVSLGQVGYETLIQAVKKFTGVS